MRNRNQQKILVVGVLAALLGFALVAFLMSRGERPNNLPANGGQETAAPAAADAPAQNSEQATTPGDTAARNADAEPARTAEPRARQQEEVPTAAQQQGDTRPRADGGDGGNDSVIAMLFGADDIKAGPNAPPESWTVVIPRIIVRLSLAALLVAALAFRPRRGVPSLPRNPYVAQTQILLAVVASALMMIVGDSAARAFGIFAAASLVRFRTNIRDPKEVTVLLISLAVGLATGVGRWELALTLAVFVFPLLWVLEHYELGQVVRPILVTVKTRDTARTQETLVRLFRRHKFNAELRQLDPSDAEEPVGCIVYFLNMNLSVSTDEMSEEIMSSDPQQIEGIEWEQTKGTGNQIYQ
ncbi:MAG TPA: DUF4956 domain-containing protein [Pyrinomonadaceae bacterium]|nr:DUF4956 domain-containing protein [Pyrinomonadaceae bacterium]